MAATRTVLKQYFKKYATPTEEQFAALIDAFVHKDEDSLTQSKIDGLSAALESKVSSSDLASAVATAVVETLQGGNIEVTPAAHQHAIADVEDLQAFVTKVNNFLESEDVSDETINRWVEIETFLTGITDQETLAGLLLNLKNEILAQIPEPQTGNYLKQISDLDAYTEAQEGEIVQYVGSTTENYKRGFCYEKKSTPLPSGQFCITLNGEITSASPVSINDRHLLKSGVMYQYYRHSFGLILTNGDRQPAIGDKVWISSSHTITTITNIQYTTITLADGQRLYNSTDPVLMEIELMKNSDGLLFFGIQGYSESNYIQHPETKYYDTYPDSCKFLLVDGENGIPIHSESVTVGSTDGLVANSWQAIVTSPVVS